MFDLGGIRVNRQHSASDVERMANAIHLLNTAPSGLILTADDKDAVYAALLAFDHEWKGDHWSTAFGPVRTMAELRKIRDRVSRGEQPERSGEGGS